MANKKCTVCIVSSIGDVVLNNVLKVAKVPRGAATIIRDSSGRVIQVVIKLPETASEAAIAALKATPGVADVVVDDVPEGFDGWDGTALSLAALTASGYAVGAPMGTLAEITYNSDGTATLVKPAGGLPWQQGQMDISGLDKCSPSPLPFDSGIKMKVVGQASVRLAADNGLLAASFNVLPDSVTFYGSNGDSTSVLADMTVMHTIRMTIDSLGLATGYLDGVVVSTLQLSSAGPSSNIIIVSFVIYGAQSSIVLDYVRWAK